MFRKTYAAIMKGAQHRYAIWSLLILSFLEAWISPITPLALLVPMVLAKPGSPAWYLVLWATLAATLGSIVGYILGYYFIELLRPFIISWGYIDVLAKADIWFSQWGLWALFVSSLLPIPFKIFTIAAGAFNIGFLAFVIMVLIARAVHFALIPIAIHFSEQTVRKWLAYKTKISR